MLAGRCSAELLLFYLSALNLLFSPHCGPLTLLYCYDYIFEQIYIFYGKTAHYTVWACVLSELLLKTGRELYVIFM